MLITPCSPPKAALKPFIYLAAALRLAHLGLPDLGISTLEDVLIDVRRITDAVDTPLLVDIDTGWGGAFNIARISEKCALKRVQQQYILKTKFRQSVVGIARIKPL